MRNLLTKVILIFTIPFLFTSCEKEEPEPKYTPPPTACNYTIYSGATTCQNSGYHPVSPTLCCPDASPYWCSGSSYCYASCTAAASGCNGSVWGSSYLGGGSSSSGSGSSSGSSSSGSGSSGSSSSGSSSSSGGGGTGTLIVWNSKSTPCPAGAGTVVSVYIGGSYAGGIGSYCTSAPDCSLSSNCAIKSTLAPGNYSVSAKCGTSTWPVGTATISNGGCYRLQLN